MLYCLGKGKFARNAANVALRAGAKWDEEAAGTNAIGTALAEQHPISVLGSEHFFDAHEILSCSAVPIFDPYGALPGVLDLTKISNTLFALLSPGDRVVSIKDSYERPSQLLIEFLPRFGIEVSLCDTSDHKAIEAAIGQGCKAVYLESPTNPTVKVVDLARVAAVAHRHKALVIVDNTFATPINQQPINLGADLVIHSATSFSADTQTRSEAWFAAVSTLSRRFYHFREITGACLDPMSAYLLLRGMKTLQLRIERQNQSALKIARFLESHSNVVKVFYPGLESHEHHEVARRQMSGFGGVLSFVIQGGFDSVKSFLPRLRYAHLAANLGAVETVAGPPSTTSHVESSKEERAAFTFPGQGSQAVGMGKALAEAFPAARAVFDEVDAALGEKLTAIIWDGPAETLQLTENAQPALMAVSLATLRVLETEAGFSVGRDAAFVAGHSLGEYSALAAAGSLSISDTARLLRIRGLAMQKAVPVGVGAMAALLGLDYEAAVAVASEAAQGQVCQAANDNGGGQVVVSGDKAAVERALEIAKTKGAKRAMLLPVSAPFHCSLMQPAADVMAKALADVTIRPPASPLVSNVLAAPIIDPDEIRRRLVEQVTGTVRWRESVAYMASHGVTRFFEIGAGKVLSGLVKRIADGAVGIPVGGPNDINAAKDALAAARTA